MALHSIPVENSAYRVSGGAYVATLEDVTVVEDFEGDTPLSNFSGKTADWTVVTSPVFNGEQAIQTDLDFPHIHDTGETRIAKGSDVNYRVQSSVVEGANAHTSLVNFGYDESTSDYYQVRVLWYDTPEIAIYKNVGGSFTFIDFDSISSVSANTWYRLNVVWDDGSLGGSDNDITAELFDTSDTSLAAVTVNDSDHATGEGFGFDGDVDTANSETLAVDYVTAPVEGEAPAVLVVDTFDDESLSEYSGHTDEYSFVSSPAKSGSALRRDATDFNAFIHSTSGLDNYPAQGDEFEVYIRSTDVSSQSDGAFRFGLQDSSNFYGAYFDMNGDGISIRKDSSVIDSSTVSFTFSADTWYRIHVQWDDGSTFGGSAGDITYTIEEDGNASNSSSTSANDTGYTSGGIGIYTDKSTDDRNLYLDEAVIL